MTNEINHFFWNANANNCLAILGYELQGSAEVECNRWYNDAAPSAIVSNGEESYTIFFPSTYKRNEQESKFVIFDSEDNFLVCFEHIEEVVTYFQATILI
jgi:hypothetical protein